MRNYLIIAEELIDQISRIKKYICFLLVIILTFSLTACSTSKSNTSEATTEATADSAAESDSAEVNNEIIILYTSDVHCGLDQGLGFVGLEQVRKTLEQKGYTTLLVDDGDFVQGDVIGTVSKGESIIEMMNNMNYDVVTLGNHEFDYGMDQFFKLAEEAKFPIICCNFTKEGKRVYDSYLIKEVNGVKIGFVGVTTPTTLTSSNPKYFQDEYGNYIYDFMNDDSGQKVYDAVQEAVDAARADGADYVYLMGHMGLFDSYSPWSCKDIISNTTGIDVMFDGHSHDTEQLVIQNKDGDDVVRTACGTKMECIGYSQIIPGEGIQDTNIWSWANNEAAPDLFGLHNKIGEELEGILKDVDEKTGTVIAKTSVTLTINDPDKTDDAGQPIRMVRRAETNLGDLCTDAFREQTGADICILNGGAIRTSIDKGDVTYRNIIDVMPFSNQLCVIEATGQQILDALEWGAREVPDENGGFFQVSGLIYEIDASIESGCKEDDDGMCTGIEGERRVKNVKIGDEDIDKEKTYTVGSIDYILKENGDGLTAFDGATVVKDQIKIDSQAMIDYITDTLNGEIGEGYEDLHGEGRITILNLK